MTEPALRLSHVSKTFHLNQVQSTTLKERLFNMFRENKRKIFKAVDDVSLEIMPGEILGLIGRNGSGKSTLVKIMSGAFIPDEGGEINRRGTSMLLNLGVGISHELTARQNIYVSGSTLGLRIKQIDHIFDKILAFAELESFADTKIKYFSSGMVQRLSFSIAVNVQADIMFLDEVFAVGDEMFRKKAIAELEKSWMNNRTVILVSHSMEIIGQYCHRVLYLKKGKIAFLGDPKTAIQHYYEMTSAIKPPASHACRY
jgi:ABC-2 type transport system ATP-binding protein